MDKASDAVLALPSGERDVAQRVPQTASPGGIEKAMADQRTENAAMRAMLKYHSVPS
jgi:hypothetical protein